MVITTKGVIMLDHKISLLELKEILKEVVTIASQQNTYESKRLVYIPFDRKFRVYKNNKEIFCTIYQNEALENYNEID